MWYAQQLDGANDSSSEEDEENIDNDGDDDDVVEETEEHGEEGVCRTTVSCKLLMRRICLVCLHIIYYIPRFVINIGCAL